MFKYQLFKPSRLRFDNWVFGPQKFAGPSKLSKLFGRISSSIILFLSPKRTRLEPRNFAIDLIFILFTTYEKTSFTEEASRSFFRAQKFFGTIEKRASGVCFSKVPKLFGRISGNIILFVSSKRRRTEARNFAVIFIFIPLRTYEKTSFTE